MALENFENSLQKCNKNDKHIFNSKSKKCIWCELEKRGFYAFGNAPLRNKATQTKHVQNFTLVQTNPSPSCYSNYYTQQNSGMNQALKYFLIISFVILFSVGVSSISFDNTVGTSGYEYNQQFIQNDTQE